jgi:hypothetical protein
MSQIGEPAVAATRRRGAGVPATSACRRHLPCSTAGAGAPPDADSSLAVMDTEALVTRIRSEFNESPGMCLTLRQGARLWGIPPEECAKLVERLVQEDFLRWTRNGELVRSDSGSFVGFKPGPDGSVR